MNNKFAGNWTVVSPSGTTKDIGNIVLNPSGTYTTTNKGVQPSNSTNEKKQAPPSPSN